MWRFAKSPTLVFLMQKVVVHPSYRDTPSNNDVALIQLDAPVRGVKLVKLAEAEVGAVRPLSA